jgi:hypothetical protein
MSFRENGKSNYPCPSIRMEVIRREDNLHKRKFQLKEFLIASSHGWSRIIIEST